MTDGGLRVLALADGSTFHAERYVDELRRQGCDVELASLETGKNVRFNLKKRKALGHLNYPMASLQVRRLIREFRPDLINPHFVSGYGFISTFPGVRNGVPVLMHLWGSDVLVVPYKSGLHHWKVRYALSRASHVCGDSEYLIDASRRITPYQCKSSVIPWGIEERFLTLHKAQYELGKPLKIIVPRSHERVYNNTLVVRALAPLIIENKVKVTFPSFGSLSDRFVHDANSLVGDKVQLYERCTRDRFLSLMAEHDVYVSNASSDSSPASLIEAMGLGLIPAVAENPGVREWITSENGYLFEPFVASSLHDTIAAIVQKGDKHTEMREANLERVRQKGVFENCIRQTIDIMNELVGSD